MGQGYYRDVITELKRAGFRQIAAGKGSHEKWESPQGKWVLVPRNTKSRHTANAILKSAGLGAKF
ncbi:hypothetical protein X907_2091 [Glycocaulis alkaliphilus]|uniref:Uncharacterized protein n=1 Tax=Glycocaulis alkaliphilus TaxID=1434191 RepID=A0A3T0EBB4_9PROT|nr:hypothetical protein X907_2091 [Glycocaulis alkaliphilus]GGB69076.1 hypothetical protein GCM10007417_06110 [Glycocaulis alkaliphilus]